MAFALTTSMNEKIIVPFDLSQRQDVLYAVLNTIVLCARSTNHKKDKKESFELTAGIFGKSSKQACSRISNGMVGRSAA